MFYSTEILGRRSPLGAIWIAAHGKRLNRNKILSVNIVDTCNKIMDPDIPQALRLQGILIGGIVIVFSKQQNYLLDDCNDAMRRVQGLADQQRAATSLAKDKQRARPDKITLQGMDLLGLDDNITGAHLLEDALQAMDAVSYTEAEEDFFVMQTLDSTFEIHTPGRDSMDNGIGLTPNPRTGFADIDFDAALTLDQPERFDAPEMDMDLPDMEARPFITTPKGGQEDQTRTSERDLQDPPPDFGDHDMGPLPDGSFSPPMEPGSEHKQAGSALLDAVMQPEDVPLTPALAEEYHPPAAAQGRKRGKRKATAALILDDPEHTLVDRKVYREWTVNRESLLTERPKRISIDPALVPFELLPSPIKGAWPAELLDMLQSKIELPLPGKKKQKSKGGKDEFEPVMEGELVNMDIDQWPEHAPFAPEEAVWPSPGEQQIDPQMEDMPGEDIPDEAELQAAADEEGLPVEQLRAAFQTPQAAAEQLKALQQGMASGSSKHSSLKSLLARRARGSSQRRSSSATKPTRSVRSLASTVRRLSDVREDEGAVDFDILAGDLDALLPAVHEAEEHEPQHPGLLTQFQIMGDSLMEAYERQTQPTQRNILNKHTTAIMKALQDQFNNKEQATGATPSVSVNALTASMTKRHAAKIFYQICAVTSIGFVTASQEEPYGDILLMPGTKYSLDSPC